MLQVGEGDGVMETVGVSETVALAVRDGVVEGVTEGEGVGDALAQM